MTTNHMTYKQGQALARFIATMRPDWDTPGIEDALGKARSLAPCGDLAIAAIKAASAATNRTPAVIAMEGAHWRGAEHKPQRTYDPRGVCQRCGQSEQHCRTRWGDDHEFLSVEEARTVRSAPRPPGLHVVPPPPAPDRPPLADLAAPAVAVDTERMAAAQPKEDA